MRPWWRRASRPPQGHPGDIGRTCRGLEGARPDANGGEAELFIAADRGPVKRRRANVEALHLMLGKGQLDQATHQQRADAPTAVRGRANQHPGDSRREMGPDVAQLDVSERPVVVVPVERGEDPSPGRLFAGARQVARQLLAAQRMGKHRGRPLAQQRRLIEPADQPLEILLAEPPERDLHTTRSS